jgi:peptide deformylase
MGSPAALPGVESTRPPGRAGRVLLLGDPRLRAPCTPVEDVHDPRFREERERLEATLDAFRAERGFGRGIAAPQIGISRCFVSLNLGAGTFTLVNPVITWRSRETFTLWDDCMCFPDLLVRVRRHLSVSVSWLDEEGRPRSRERVPQAESELLQHELDHLGGVLATDLALDARSLVDRSVFDADPAYFRSQVDYVIEPTIRPA